MFCTSEQAVLGEQHEGILNSELSGEGSQLVQAVDGGDGGIVVGADGGLVGEAGMEGGILLTTDTDGNLSVPVSADHVIRLFMQTSDVSHKQFYAIFF